MVAPLLAAAVIGVLHGPSRELTYAFSIDTGTTQQRSMDAGTITVDVLYVQADSGTVVSVSERSHSRANLHAATCVTYGIGLVICSPQQNVTVEEMSLLRVAGRNFVNWSAIGAKRTWQYAESDGRAHETNDYRITNMRDGILDITFQRALDVSAPDGYVAQTSGNLSYNQGSSLPIALTQETVTRPQPNFAGVRIDEHLTLTLERDSLARAP
jgi:hypothetical protein